jgi:hypothetical protein
MHGYLIARRYGMAFTEGLGSMNDINITTSRIRTGYNRSPFSMRIDPFVEIIALVMLHVVFFLYMGIPRFQFSSYASRLPLVPNVGLSCTVKTHQYVLLLRFEMSSVRCELAKLVSNHILSNGHLVIILSIVHLELETDKVGKDCS